MGCSTLTVKYLLLLSNFLCALLGLATIVVNALALKNMENDERPILGVFIALGSIVFLISFIGCFGPIKENMCLIWTYATSMLALLILSVAVLFVFRMHIDGATTAEDVLNRAFDKQTNSVDAMAEYQNKFLCCGINGAKDYTNHNLTVPGSCFGTGDNAYSIGCREKMESYYEELWQGPKIVVWVLIVMEIAAFTFSTILGVQLRNENRRDGY